MRTPAEQGNPNLAKCMSCHGVVSKDAETCPHCGKRFRQSDASRSIGLVLLALLIGLCAYFMLTIQGGGSNLDEVEAYNREVERVNQENRDRIDAYNQRVQDYNQAQGDSLERTLQSAHEAERKWLLGE